MKVEPIQFVVFGIPAPGGSKKPFTYKGKDGKVRASMAPDSEKTKPWMALVKSAAMEAYDGPLLTGAIEFKMTFYYLRIKGHYGSGRNFDRLKDSAPKYKLTKPDCTKTVRSTEDALKGILWHDDSQVIRQQNEKDFCRKGERPRAEITVTPLEEQW